MSVEDLISPVANQTSWTEKAYQNIYKMRSKALMNMFVRQSTQHKHQHVATIGGISFFDDAFALSPNATWFTFYQSTTSVIWILENLNTSPIDFTEQLDVIKDKVKQIVLIDDSNNNEVMIAQLKKVVNVVVVKDMHSAVELAYHLAAKESSVIYSPSSGTIEQAQQRAEEFIQQVYSL